MAVTSVYQALSRAEAKSYLTDNGAISKIAGHPRCHSLMSLLSELTAQLRRIPCEYSDNGYLFLGIPEADYLLLTGEQIAPPMQPPDFPQLDPNGTEAQHRQVQLMWDKQFAQWNTVKNINLELIEAARSAMEPSYARSSVTLVGTTNTNVFLEWFNNLFGKWGIPTPEDIEINDRRMKAPWDPATRDFEDVLRQIEDSAIFARLIRKPKSDHDLLNAGLLVVKGCGMFANEVKAWNLLPEADKTWANFKTFFSEQLLACHLAGVSTTPGLAGYSANVEGSNASQTTASNIEADMAASERAYTESVANLAQSQANNAAAFNTMSNDEIV